MQVTSRLQMSNAVQRLSCDLRNHSDLHCQLNVGLIVTDWGFADFYTVILKGHGSRTQIWPWPWPLMSLGSDNCAGWHSQSNTILTSKHQQWEKSENASELIQSKNIVVGGTLIYTFLFLNPNSFRVLDPYIVISETPHICTVNSLLVWLSPTEALLIFIQSFDKVLDQ